jgi:anti-sigma B factor antagonist
MVVQPQSSTVEAAVRFRKGRKNLVFNLYINERRIEDVTVLDLKGRIRLTGRTRGLHNSIRSLVEKGKTRILLNLSQVTHIDSSGLDELVASCVTACIQGGEIKLLHLTEQMREVITTANLAALFDIYNDEYDAIASFNREVLRVMKPLASLSNDDAVAAIVHSPGNAQVSTTVI